MERDSYKAQPVFGTQIRADLKGSAQTALLKKSAAVNKNLRHLRAHPKRIPLGYWIFLVGYWIFTAAAVPAQGLPQWYIDKGLAPRDTDGDGIPD
jgi:hypothetical protein